MLLNCGVGEDSWEYLGLQGDPLAHLKEDESRVFIGRTDVEACNSNILATWCEELTLLKRPWCWERLKAGGERDDRGWDGWMASPTQWTWVWVNSGSWWWTGRPGVLWFMESHTVRHHAWLNWTELEAETTTLTEIPSHTVLLLQSVSSATQLCQTLCDAMDCSTPGLPILHQPLQFTQTHVHWVSDAIQLYHPLSSPSPPAFNLSQHQGLFKRVSSSHQVAKVLELQLQHQSFQWLFRTDLGLIGLISLQSKGLSRVFCNTTVQKHQFFGAQLSLKSNSPIHT